MYEKQAMMYKETLFYILVLLEWIVGSCLFNATTSYHVIKIPIERCSYKYWNEINKQNVDFIG